MKALRGQWRRFRDLGETVAQKAQQAWPRSGGTEVGSSAGALRNTEASGSSQCPQCSAQYASQNIPGMHAEGLRKQMAVRLVPKASSGGQQGWGPFAFPGVFSLGLMGLGGTAMLTYMNRPDLVANLAADHLRDLGRTFTEHFWQERRPSMGNFLADAAAVASPAVVNITANAKPDVPPALLDGPWEAGLMHSDPCGSGFIIEESGILITAAHVVDSAIYKQQFLEGKTKKRPLRVEMQDGRVMEGEVLGIDRNTDLAMVQIKASSPLPVVKLGSSQRLRMGEWVLALGSPLTLQNSVTAGVVSCAGRKAEELGLHGNYQRFIQTDAAINNGNSGGPLLNMAGEVIGISCMRAIGSDGVSFAIPIDDAMTIIKEMKANNGRIVRPYVGMKILELNPDIIRHMRKKNPKFSPLSKGVLVPNVSEGGPADKAGLKPGDVITSVDDKSGPVNVANLMSAFQHHLDINTDIKLHVQRERQSLVLELTVCEALN